MTDTAVVEGETTWTEGFDEVQTGLAQTKGWTGPADVVKAYQHAATFLGRDPSTLVQVPAGDATDTDLDVFYDKVGRPKEAGAYARAELEGASTERDDAIAERAHKLGLSQRQFDLMRAAEYESAAGDDKASAESQQADIQTTRTALKAKWGAAFEERDSLAFDATDFLGIKVEDLVKGGLMGGDRGPEIMDKLASLGAMLSEDQVQGGGDAQQFQMTAEQARSEISQLRGSDEFMKHYLSLDKLSQAHKGAVEKMQRLHAIGYPEAA